MSAGCPSIKLGFGAAMLVWLCLFLPSSAQSQAAKSTASPRRNASDQKVVVLPKSSRIESESNQRSANEDVVVVEPESRPGQKYKKPSSFQTPPSVLPTRDAILLDALTENFRSIQSSSGSRVPSATLAMLAGGAAIGFGVWIDNEIGANFFAQYLFISGGAQILRGLVDLFVYENPQDAAITFSNMPFRTPAQAEQKLAWGIEQFRRISIRSKVARYSNATIGTATGLITIPLYLSQNGDPDGPEDYIVLISASLTSVLGLFGFFARSGIERRWDAFEDLRNETETVENSQNQLQMGVSVAPLPGGAMASAQVRF